MYVCVYVNFISGISAHKNQQTSKRSADRWTDSKLHLQTTSYKLATMKNVKILKYLILQFFPLKWKSNSVVG